MYLHRLFSSIICLLWFKLCWEHQQSMLIYYWPLDLPHRFTSCLEEQKTICCLLLFCRSRLRQKLFGFNVTYKNGASCLLTTPLCCDNQSAIHIALWMNQAHWVEIDCHFICHNTFYKAMFFFVPFSLLLSWLIHLQIPSSAWFQ